ncbi:MAG: DEAD/DEAH box helicase family protein [Parachlamydiales bacterium]|nr:DEAD/DEAH box helicase family protein [Parachlamydiales bacterium]
MLNFRKLKQDFSSAILKEGRDLYDQGMVLSAKILSLDTQKIRLNSRIQGNFKNVYESEIEIDRFESEAIDSKCDCTDTYDCQHLAAILFYLEKHLDEIIVAYSSMAEAQIATSVDLDDEEKKKLQKTFKEAACKETLRKNEKVQRELLQEYLQSSQLLSSSPFFLPKEELTEDRAELALLFLPPSGNSEQKQWYEVQLALRLPYRSKPLYIAEIKEFLESVRYNEPVYLGGKRYFFTFHSFDEESAEILTMIIDHARFPESDGDKLQRIGLLNAEAFGTLLAKAYEFAVAKHSNSSYGPDEKFALPCLYNSSLENPLCFSARLAHLRFELEYFETPEPKVLMKPTIVVDQMIVAPEDGALFECSKPGFIYKNVYHRFPDHIKRMHLRHLQSIRNMTIPKPLFGTFVENSLPELLRFAEVDNRELLEHFVTLPFVGQVTAKCDIQYLDGELEAALYFIYDDIEIPAASNALTFKHIDLFVTEHGVLARDLAEEREMIQTLFHDFIYDSKQGVFVAKTEKKIVEFMTEVVPKNKNRVKFHTPENLQDQFIYDQSEFTLHFQETERMDMYAVDLQVDGHLKGVKTDHLWDCITSKKTFLQLEGSKARSRSSDSNSLCAKNHKILVVNLEKLAPIVQFLDEIGIKKLDTYREERPLWSLASVSDDFLKGLPIKITMSKKLKEIQNQMLGIKPIDATPIPTQVTASLRNYQVEGVNWLERLRIMHLNGVLADDMGLGKTLQAIVAVTQFKKEHPGSISLVVCPTSLLYNWKEEFSKFNDNLKVLVIDGIPTQRKKLLDDMPQYDIIVTSYTLLQKDIETYKKVAFAYAILDEAQHIKNRGTRNAKSAKLIQAKHRLILTGTPIENSLDELWSLFDFLMPGLLSSYDRFVEKYIRNSGYGISDHLDNLRKKVAPFILRRMKSDVLSDLPPVTEIVYYCHLSDVQKELYRSYAASAREELSKLVKKEGFDKVQIHVLATLTRLKQICCHPAIFAKEKPEELDSSKYEMLLELIQALIEGKHKTVIFSQYTRMLNIMRDDLEARGIRFAYLDGSSKNRLEIVKHFNEDESIPIFLVSLKAGGAGLNITGADTVIHYDMWWNPAVENQATDRVHRMGQKRSVSSYKLITLGTIEEKILMLQNRKKGLVKKVVSCDDEAMSKLTWEEVLELLQT